MKLLITGGTGFIGQALCQQLIAAGHELLLMVHKRRPKTLSANSQVRLLEHWSDLTPDSRIDGIINLAGASIAARRWSAKRKAQLLESRLQPTEALIRFIARADYRPAVLISGSAVGYYGDQQQLEVTEATEPALGFSHQLCQQWERLAMTAQSFKVRTCILRTGLVLGPGGGFLAQMLPLFRLGLGGRLGSGEQWMPWVHRDDFIGLVLWLLANQRCQGVYNATAPQPVTNNEFTQTLAAVLQRPALVAMPAPLLRLAFGEMSELLLGGQKALPRHALEEGFGFQYENLELALRQVIKGRPR